MANDVLCLDVNSLMIDPDYQRRGIGGKLLSVVLREGDKQGIPTFLVSTAESRGLYGKMVFESPFIFPSTSKKHRNSNSGPNAPRSLKYTKKRRNEKRKHGKTERRAA